MPAHSTVIRCMADLWRMEALLFFCLCLSNGPKRQLYSLFFYHEVTPQLLLSGDQDPSQKEPILRE